MRNLAYFFFKKKKRLRRSLMYEMNVRDELQLKEKFTAVSLYIAPHIKC